VARVGAKAARLGLAAAFIGPGAGHLGVRARGTGRAWHGRRDEPDSGSGQRGCNAEEGMTCGSRTSATAGSDARGWAGKNGRLRCAGPEKSWALLGCARSRVKE
jgi:hypothetical protein